MGGFIGAWIDRCPDGCMFNPSVHPPAIVVPLVASRNEKES
jgi:hypothetical protein